jgi:hypothetical protein
MYLNFNALISFSVGTTTPTTGTAGVIPASTTATGGVETTTESRYFYKNVTVELTDDDSTAAPTTTSLSVTTGKGCVNLLSSCNNICGVGEVKVS